MNKQTLMKYAEPGIRARLHEIQDELNTMHRDFPHIVANADGTVPSVLPIELKASAPKNGNGNGHGGKRIRLKTYIEPARTFLAAHPGASAKEVAAAVGTEDNSGFRDKVLRVIAKPKTAGKLRGTPQEWHVK